MSTLKFFSLLCVLVVDDRLVFNYSNYMEENKKEENCCLGGKCVCNKRWVRVLLMIASVLVIFILGIAVGSCGHRGMRMDGQRNFSNSVKNIESCKMMGNKNQGAGCPLADQCPRMNEAKKGIDATSSNELVSPELPVVEVQN